MKRSTRILALFLAVLLCFSLMFEAALAADGSETAPEESILPYDQLPQAADDNDDAAEKEASALTEGTNDADTADKTGLSADAFLTNTDNTERDAESGDSEAGDNDTDSPLPSVSPDPDTAASAAAEGTESGEGLSDSTETPETPETSASPEDPDAPDPVNTADVTATPEPTDLPAPELDSLTEDDDGVTLTWKPVEGASLYRVFRKSNSDKDWVKLEDTAETEYLDPDTTPNTKYAYSVCCVTSDGETEASPYDETGLTITTKYLPTPVLTSIAAKDCKVILTWEAVPGAKMYRVFRKTEGSTSWAKLTDTADTTYTAPARYGTKYAYTVRCVTDDGAYFTSDYDRVGLSVATQPLATPVLKSITSKNCKAVLTWAAVPGAEMYRVFRKTESAASWTKLADTTDTTYSVAATYEEKYVYTVRCVTPDGTFFTSDFDKTGLSIATQPLSSPVLKTIANKGYTIQVTWGAVSGAEMYRVYRKVDGATKWERIGSTNSTTFTDKDIIPNVKYTYTVRCLSADEEFFTSTYDKDGISITSKALDIPVLKSIENKGYTIQLTWNAVSGAEQYRVYRKAEGDSSWTRVKTTKDTSCLDAGIIPNMKYTYTVRCLTADGKHFTSSYNKTGISITSKKLSAPVLKSISRNGAIVTLKWDAVPNAEMYRVFRKAEGASTWSKVTDTDKTTYTGTAPYGEKYAYTVRCVTADGSHFTSAYDNTGLTVTIPTLNSLSAPVAQEGTVVSGGSWKKSNGNWYYYKDDKAIKSGLYKIDGDNYYFDSKGVMQTGWVKTTYKTTDGKTHSARSFFNTSSGIRKESGWGRNGDYWVYFVKGFTLVDTLYIIAGDYYYFDSDGHMATGWTKYTSLDKDGNTIKVCSWFDSDGIRKESGWMRSNGNWYYFADGIRMEDIDRVIAGDHYYFDSDGIMHIGWLKVSYTDANGKTKTGKRYYLSDGVRCENGSYKIGSSYYIFSDSILQTEPGWVEAGGSRYYIKSDGTVRTGWWTTNGNTYYFNSIGKLSTGLVMISGSPYYFYDGTEKGGGAKYTMAKNTTVNGYKINSKGVCTNLSTKTELLLEAQNHTSPNNYLIVIDHIYCGLGIYKRDSNGDWYTYKYMSCAPGAYSTPTYTGTYKITSSRGYYFDSGSVRCFWYSTFNGNQAIHSVLYYPEGSLADGRLGMRLSHGCVRVSYSNAKWIYDYIPTGTTVVVI